MEQEPKKLAKSADKAPKDLSWLDSCALVAGPLPEKIDVPHFSLDIETTGLSAEADHIVGISISTNASSTIYCPVAHLNYENVPLSDCIKKIQGWLDSGSLMVTLNHKFDGAFLAKAGLRDEGRFKDVQILLYAGCPELFQKGSGLKALTKAALGLEMLDLNELFGLTKAAMKRTPPNFASLPVDRRTLSYAGADALATFRLYEYYLKNKQPGTDNIATLDHAVIAPIQEMEANGILIDDEEIERLGAKIEEEREKLAQALKGIMGADVNIGSPKQLRDYFFVRKALTALVRTPKDEPSTSTTALRALQRKYGKKYPEISWLIEYRKLDTLRKSYIKPITAGLKNGRLYPSFKSASLITGRIASTGQGFSLNMQGIPKSLGPDTFNIRKAFVADDGWQWVSIDMSNIELRLIASFSRDPALIEALTAPGGDLHAVTAKRLFNADPSSPDWKKHRKIAKICNYNLAYAFGIQALRGKLEEEMGEKMSEDKCWDIYNTFFEKAYPQWGKWKKDVLKEARMTGYASTLWGRKRYIGDLYKQQSFFGCAGDRAAVNFVVQGFCADLMRRAMVYCYRYIRSLEQVEVKMLSTIHDELNFLVKDNENKDFHIEKLAEIIAWTPPQVVVKLAVDVEVGKSWGMLEKWEKK